LPSRFHSKKPLFDTRQRRCLPASRYAPDVAHVSMRALMPDHFFASSGPLRNHGTKFHRTIKPSRPCSPSRITMEPGPSAVDCTEVWDLQRVLSTSRAINRKSRSDGRVFRASDLMGETSPHGDKVATSHRNATLAAFRPKRGVVGARMP